MKCNVGGRDRWIRMILGIVILGVGYYMQSWWGLVGLIPLLTGATKRCLIYYPMKVSTAETEE